MELQWWYLRRSRPPSVRQVRAAFVIELAARFFVQHLGSYSLREPDLDLWLVRRAMEREA